MIYLVDDNKYGQMSANYKLDFTKVLLPYQSVIIWLQTISENYINNIISDAVCILIHDSYEEKEDKERLVALAKKNNIPYCLFSNGFAATIFDGDSIKEIKKDRLYNNLLDFVKYFDSEGKVDLKLLSLGQNYEIERASIIQDRLISGTLLLNKDNFNYEVAFPSGSIEYKDLRELVYLSDPSMDFSDFEDTYNTKDTTAQSLRSVIISLTKIVKKRHEEKYTCNRTCYF
jgi:hypothetical protein